MDGQPDNFQGNTFSELYAEDTKESGYAFLLPYPCTAGWSPYPNTKKYFIQDGNREEKKVGFDKIRQKEPWKIMAVMGDDLPGVMTSRPPDLLLNYWKDTFGHHYENMAVLPHERWGSILNEEAPYQKLIMLFPFDDIRTELHAVDPENHYYLLSKCSLSYISPSVPEYRVVNLKAVAPEQIDFPHEFPYAVKTSHGLSGEGTYIIKNGDDLDACIGELNIYREVGLAEHIVIMNFVANTRGNYCVQFYVSKTGAITFIGATSQLVSETGAHLGGVIRYDDTDISAFVSIIQSIGKSMFENGYFGVVGVDILEDADGVMHVIDANIRVNGSTPLCLQRKLLMSQGKTTAKYSTDYFMKGSLDEVLTTLKPELDSLGFMILSTAPNPLKPDAETDIYGIVTGESVEAMIRQEEQLKAKGLLER